LGCIAAFAYLPKAQRGCQSPICSQCNSAGGTPTHPLLSTDRLIDYDSEASWTSALAFDLIYDGRDYEPFGWLFWVRNYAGFRAVAVKRACQTTWPTRQGGFVERGDFFGVTWVGWSELVAVDWDEPAEHPTLGFTNTTVTRPPTAAPVRDLERGAEYLAKPTPDHPPRISAPDDQGSGPLMSF
jgi:hypothetical protein